jgi:hypothetical protein
MLRGHTLSAHETHEQLVLPLAVSAPAGHGVVHAQEHTRARRTQPPAAALSKSSETDFVTVVVGDYQQSPENNYLIGAT